MASVKRYWGLLVVAIVVYFSILLAVNFSIYTTTSPDEISYRLRSPPDTYATPRVLKPSQVPEYQRDTGVHALPNDENNQAVRHLHNINGILKLRNQTAYNKNNILPHMIHINRETTPSNAKPNVYTNRTALSPNGPFYGPNDHLPEKVDFQDAMFRNKTREAETIIGKSANFRQFHRERANELVNETAQLRLKATTRSSQLITSEPRFMYKLRTVYSQCEGQVRLYNKILVVFTNITVHPSLCGDTHRGAEALEDVMEQNETLEFYSFKLGCFAMDCGKLKLSSLIHIDAQLHFYRWTRSILEMRNPLSVLTRNFTQANNVNSKFTIVLVRYEYANVYWNLVDIYDSYLIARANQRTLDQVNVLIMDAHPAGKLDEWWHNTFGSIQRLPQIHEPTLYTQMSWLFSRVHSPLLDSKEANPPYWMDFRDLILARNRINDDHIRNCSIPVEYAAFEGRNFHYPRLHLLLIWRRDYVAHPRNPSGLISRIIKNEEELEIALRNYFVTFHIKTVQLELLPIEKQLYLISHSDILLGMHGAAMAFSFVMKPGSALIELYPKYYKGYNWHIETIVRWTKHFYYKWHNYDEELEDRDNQYTTVPVQRVIELVETAAYQLCNMS